MTGTILGSLMVFVLACGALSLGQWFGRPPIHGRCHPRENEGCGSPDCCRLPANERES